MKRTSLVTLSLAMLAAGTMLSAHPADAQPMCSVDTDCTNNGSSCGTDTCDPTSHTCGRPARTTARA
jgi:hypothetical protein